MIDLYSLLNESLTSFDSVEVVDNLKSPWLYPKEERLYTTTTGAFGESLSNVHCSSTYTLELRPNQLVNMSELSTRKPEGEEETDPMERVTIPMPTKILRNGRATVVYFADDTKVVVKLPEGVEDCDYNAFCAAIAKKMFGTNTRIKRKMEQITQVVPTREEQLVAIMAAKEEAEAKKQAQIDRKVQRMAHQIILEKRAEQLAKELMENA